MKQKVSFQLSRAVPFNYKKLGEKYLLVNEWGDHIFLGIEDFENFLQNKLSQQGPLTKELEKNNFLRDKINPEAIVRRYQAKKSYLFQGPGLHIVVVSLRCNQKCLYCSASVRGEAEKNYDMSPETADKVLDTIFRTPNHYLAIEFQGGEPLINWAVVKHIVEGAEKRNKIAKKDLQIRLVTNGGLMTADIFDYLIKHKVSLCFSFDGPEKLHNKQRCGPKNSYKKVVYWLKEFNKNKNKFTKKGYYWSSNTRLTITKFSFPFFKEIIDEHVKLGLKSIYICNLSPFGFAKTNWPEVGYSIEEFLEFYRHSLDYIIKLNLEGKKINERLAGVFLTKILSERDPNHLEFRSPCGAGTGQLAYNYNGDVYTCDEGRMLAMMGDRSFKAGNVYENKYEDLVNSPAVKSVCTASCIESLPGCETCAYQPYCGVCPIYNYAVHGNIFAPEPNNERCRLNQGIMDYLFGKIQDKKYFKILKNWY